MADVREGGPLKGAHLGNGGSGGGGSKGSGGGLGLLPLEPPLYR